MHIRPSGALPQCRNADTPLPPSRQPGRDTAATDAAAISRLDELTARMPTVYGREFRRYVDRVGALAATDVDAVTATEMTRPFAWLIDRVGTEGLTLTQAGWLPPVVVSDAMRELGWEDRWFGKMNREDATIPILELRAAAQRLGLVRRLKGRLVLGTPAKRSGGDPVALWQTLASRLALHHRTAAAMDAALLLAVEVASGRHEKREQYWGPVAFGLSALGWGRRDGAPLSSDDVREVTRETWGALEIMGAFEMTRHRPGRVTTGGREFARAMLRS